MLAGGVFTLPPRGGCTNITDGDSLAMLEYHGYLMFALYKKNAVFKLVSIH